MCVNACTWSSLELGAVCTKVSGSLVLGHKEGFGFTGLRFRGLGFRGLGFRGLGF